MKDLTGRTINYLRLSITDRCNCRCVYCMPEHGVPMLRHSDIMTYDEIAEVVAAAADLGVTKVRLTGGEPLARKGVPELVSMLRAIPGIEELTMTTNATLLAPVAKELKAAGLDRVNVSLDTLNPARYRQITRTGNLSDAVAGLHAAQAAGLGPIKVNAVLMGGVNTPDIARLCDLAKHHPYHVRFIELMPIGCAANWPRERFVKADAVLEAVPELEPVGHDGVSETYAGEGWLGTVGLIRPISHKFCSDCNRIRLTADGRIKPCLHSREEVDVRGLHGEELHATLEAAMRGKPQHHFLEGLRASDSARDMNEIGG